MKKGCVIFFELFFHCIDFTDIGNLMNKNNFQVMIMKCLNLSEHSFRFFFLVYDQNLN